MSSKPAVRPRMSVFLTSERISLCERRGTEGLGNPLVAVDLDDPDIQAGLRSLAETARRFGGPVEVVLPDAEICRGVLETSKGSARSRIQRVKARASIGLSRPITELRVTIGPCSADGTWAWAAAPTEVLKETEAFITKCGLDVGALAAPGDLPPFPFGDWPDGPRAPIASRNTAVLAGAVSLTLVAFALLPWPQLGAPPDTEASAPLAITAEGPADDAPLGVAAPIARNAPATALAVSRPPRPRPASIFVASLEIDPPAARIDAPEPSPVPSPVPSMTKSTRSLPSSDIASAPAKYFVPLPLPNVVPAESELAEDAIPAFVLAQLTATLPSASDAGPAATGIRPLHRPTAVSVPEVAPASQSALEDSGEISPRPRARIAAPLTQAQLSASIASAVAIALADAEQPGRPVPRSPPTAETVIATAVGTGPEATVFQPQSPTVVRPAPEAAGPAVQPAPAVKSRAPERVGLSSREVSLVGVFGSPAKKRALVRMPNGQIRKVRTGDRLEGGRVLGVDANSVRLFENGRELVLRMSD
jgi:hypothetical protein